jgi:hypothetical protein
LAHNSRRRCSLLAVFLVRNSLLRLRLEDYSDRRRHPQPADCLGLLPLLRLVAYLVRLSLQQLRHLVDSVPNLRRRQPVDFSVLLLRPLRNLCLDAKTLEHGRCKMIPR